MTIRHKSIKVFFAKVQEFLNHAVGAAFLTFTGLVQRFVIADNMDRANSSGRLMAYGKRLFAKLFGGFRFNIKTQHSQKGLNPELTSSRCAKLVPGVFTLYARLKNFPLLYCICPATLNFVANRNVQIKIFRTLSLQATRFIKIIKGFRADKAAFPTNSRIIHY